MDSTAEASNNLKSSAGIRLQDAEYSLQYVENLRNWMTTSGHADFEDRLIKLGLISLEIKNAELGYDFLMEAMSPKDEMAFESGVIRYVPLDPNDQLNKRFKNEVIREEKRERWTDTSGLTTAEWSSLSRGCGIEENPEISIREYRPGVLRLTEPPFAEIFRNPPCTMEISHLRRLREEGAFNREPMQVQIAAYLYSKWNWEQQEIEEMFSRQTTWAEYESGKAKVKRIIKKTWPERFSRISKVLDASTKKQKAAFEVYYDIDERPTLGQAANALKIDRSSLNERLLNLRNRLRGEFTEFAGGKRRSLAWSQACDLLYSGFYRKSEAKFRPCIVTNLKTGEMKHATGSTFVTSNTDRVGVDRGKVYAWLKLRMYSPELKTVLAGSTRGYQVKRGEFFHHPEKWKEAAATELLNGAKNPADGQSRAGSARSAAVAPLISTATSNRARLRFSDPADVPLNSSEIS